MTGPNYDNVRTNTQKEKVKLAHDLMEGEASKGYSLITYNNNFLEMLKEDSNRYEMIDPNKPVKPYFDIDCKWSEDCGWGGNTLDDYLDNIVKRSQEFFEGVSLSTEDIVILDATTDRKYSYHLIVNTFYVPYEHMKAFYKYVIDKNLEEGVLLPCYDSAVYKSQGQLFRMVNQSKKGKENQLILQTEQHTIKDTLLHNYGDNEITIVRMKESMKNTQVKMEPRFIDKEDGEEDDEHYNSVMELVQKLQPYGDRDHNQPWINFGIYMWNLLGEKGLDAWKLYSINTEMKNSYDANECEERWENYIRSKERMETGTNLLRNMLEEQDGKKEQNKQSSLLCPEYTNEEESESESEVESESESDIDIDTLHDMKFTEVQEICRKRGISTDRKNKQELIDMLSSQMKTSTLESDDVSGDLTDTDAFIPKLNDKDTICSSTSGINASSTKQVVSIPDNYCFEDFFDEFKEKKFQSRKDFIEQYLPKYNRVFFHFKLNTNLVFKSQKGYEIDEPNTKAISSYIYGTSGKNEKKGTKIKFGDVMQNFKGHIHFYDEYGVYPDGRNSYGERKPANILNVWRGFEASCLESYNLDIIQPILNHIHTCWANDNTEISEFILDWLAHIVQFPWSKTKVIILLYSKKQQIGKNMLISFITHYLLGDKITLEYSGIGCFSKRFNMILHNKLLVNCNELSSIDGNDKGVFDIIKTNATDPKKDFEIKSGKNFTDFNYMNLILTTNHTFTYKVEEDDLRVLPLKCSPRYVKNRKYFHNLDSVLNKTGADHFMTFLKQRKIVGKGELKDRMPMTELKQQMIAQSLPSPSRFLNYVKDHNDFLKNEIEGNEYLADHKSKLWSEVKSTTLFQAYNSWCEMTNDKKFTNQAFMPIVAESHEKKRKKHGYVFDLSKLENKNEDNQERNKKEDN